MKKGVQNFRTLLQYLHCEEHFISSHNKFHYNFSTNPLNGIAKECVYILMNLFKSFYLVVGSELKVFVIHLCMHVYACACIFVLQQLQCFAHWYCGDNWIK